MGSTGIGSRTGGPWHQLFKQVQSPSMFCRSCCRTPTMRVQPKPASGSKTGFCLHAQRRGLHRRALRVPVSVRVSNKRALHTIGFRGIGFKSTFSLGDVVELYSPTSRSPLNVVASPNRHGSIPDLDPVGSTTIRVAFASEHQRREVEKNLQEWLKSPAVALVLQPYPANARRRPRGVWGSLGPGPVRDSEWMALHEDPNQSYLVATSESWHFPRRR